MAFLGPSLEIARRCEDHQMTVLSKLWGTRTKHPPVTCNETLLFVGIFFLISTGAWFLKSTEFLGDIKTKRTKLVLWRRIPARTWCLVMLPYYLNMRYNVPHNLTMHICSEKKRIYSDRSNDSLTAKCCLIQKHAWSTQRQIKQNIILYLQWEGHSGRKFQAFHHDIQSSKTFLWHIAHSSTKYSTAKVAMWFVGVII